jgi:23S rRNA (uracil1939-C5)-methyltransferase
VPPPGAFLQATAHGEEALLRAVLDGVGTGEKAVDLFAGCGTFALPLAAIFGVHAVEFDGSMLKALDQGWRKTAGLKHLSTEARDLFRRPLLSAEFKGVDAVVIDPPRAGAQAQISELAQADLGRVVHVSCNPVTFARDARVLVDGGFELAWVEVVDQFRWSTHVELVGCFLRNGP